VSGSGTFSGTNYQARILAHVYVHILAQARLNWLTPIDDTPVGVSGETGGPGDDMQIEFGERHPAIEVQAKHGLTGGMKLAEAVLTVRDNSKAGDTTKVVFTVDRGTSRTVHRDFASDLDRLRTGRVTPLKTDAQQLLERFGPELLHRLFVIPIDIDNEHDPETKVTLALLESVLETPQDSLSAWALLKADASDVLAKRLRRTRKDLLDILAGAKLGVRPPSQDERFVRHLDLTQRLLATAHAKAVLTILAKLETDLTGAQAPTIRYRLFQQRARAQAILGLTDQALDSARCALEIDPTGVDALVAAALAAGQAGDLDIATHYIERSLTEHPQNTKAWAVALRIAAAAGKPRSSPPASIEASDDYQTALAEIAFQQGDWAVVQRITDGLLQNGIRTPTLLHFRIAAFLSVPTDDVPAHERQKDAERLATEALDELHDEHPLFTKLLLQRAEARALLGRPDESNADLELAAQTDPRDPVALHRLAETHIAASRFDEALNVLRTRLVDDYPVLLVTRARAEASTNDHQAARRDLEAAVGRAEEAPDPHHLRLNAAAVALLLGDHALTERILETGTSASYPPDRHALLRGRLAFERGDADAGSMWLRKAIEHTEKGKVGLLAELGHNLLRLDRARDAVGVFEEIPRAELPASAYGDYASALLRSDRLDAAAALLENLAASQPLPDWAVAVSVDIALWQGDTTRAIELLEGLAARHPLDMRVRWELARNLLEIGQAAAAAPHLDELAANSSLSAEERVATASLLKQVGRNKEAVSLAFQAFRSAPQDPSIHRGFATVVMLDPSVEAATVVGADTYVHLVNADDGSERGITIYAEGPIDPLRNEMSVADATIAGYAGKQVGDVITTNAGSSWQETRWRVTEIRPAVVHAFNDVMGHYEERFPGESFFVKSFKIKDEASVRFLAPFIASLQAKKAGAQEAFRFYHEHTMPLGFVARLVGAPIADVMAAATTVEHGLDPLLVDWSDAAGQVESREAARHASEVVLTRSALETLLDLDVLDRVTPAYTWVAPRSLLNLLKNELATAQDRQANGLFYVTAGDTGVLPVKLSPEDPLFVSQASRTQKALNWLSNHVRLELRPLATYGTRDDETRNHIGSDSYDAFRLAEHISGTLFADDLGLRRFLPKGSRARSFPTTALLPILAERGLISENERDLWLLRLVERRYEHIAPTSALLHAAIRRSEGHAHLLRRPFGLLVGPLVDLPTAARIVAEVFRLELLAPVQVLEVDALVQVALEALRPRWGAVAPANAVSLASERVLRLLPQHIRAINNAAAAFVRAHRSLSSP